MACDTCAALAPSRWNVAWLPSISTIEILTVIVQVAVFSPAVAVMVAVPSPMAVTIPSGDTVATASSEDVHVASPAPSGRTVAETYPEIEFQVGDDVVRVLRVCTYRSIPWGHLMAFVNLDSYDQQFMGTVGRKEMILESQSGEQGEVWIAGPYDWWNAGDGCVAIGPEDTYVTLRYDIYGESGSIQIPLPEGETP